VDCVQGTVDWVEGEMEKHKTFSEWRKQNSELVAWGMTRGFIYVFTHIYTEADNVDVDVEKCLTEALSVTTNFTTGKSTINT
jgi:hypothetical protein